MFEMHYTGTWMGYPSKAEIDADAKKRGFTHSYWASEYGYNAMYNGDTVVVYNSTDDMDEYMKADAEKYGKPIQTADTKMTKAKALDRIAKAARMAGFDVELSDYAVSGIRIKADNIAITINRETRWNVAEGIITEKMTASASICKMGGDPTPEELIKAADEIKRGATLVQQINNWKLEYVAVMPQ